MSVVDIVKQGEIAALAEDARARIRQRGVEHACERAADTAVMLLSPLPCMDNMTLETRLDMAKQMTQAIFDVLATWCKDPYAAAPPISITRDNVDDLLDRRMIEAKWNSGRWYEIRRNGQTQKWKRTPERIQIPYKVMLRDYGQITTANFMPDGVLDPSMFRIKGTYGK